MTPSPTTSPLNPRRWQPLRGGLINLFKYEDQVFRYENGHLLLRGDNGCGKSRVLALQLPFLLDGDIRPARVEPDRDPAKRMEWHLLMDRFERRSGYTWIEFARLVDGEAAYCTLGCGLDARKGQGAPRRWFFITSERIGIDLKLTQDRVPLTERQLREHFESTGVGKLYDKASTYRDAVDQALFKLGPTRYLALVNLLIQLRQPQLMRDMKEDVLSNALSEALSPIDRTLLEQVAESFQGLEADRQQTADQREILESVDTFREGYQQYVGAAIRRLCDTLRREHNAYENAAKNLRKTEAEKDARQAQAATEDALQVQQEQALAGLEQQIATLRDSPEMRQARDLEQAEARAARARTDAERAGGAARDAADRLAVARDQVVVRRSQQQGDEQAVDDGFDALATSHESVAPKGTNLPPWRDSELKAVREQIDPVVDQRRRDIRHLQKLNEAIGVLQTRLDVVREQVRRDEADVAKVQAEVEGTQVKLDLAFDVYESAITDWEGSLRQLDEANFARGRNWLEPTRLWLEESEGAAPFPHAIQEAVRLVQADHAARERELTQEQEKVEAERRALQEAFDELQAGHQPEPAPPPLRAARPGNRPGAPFWRCFEFAPSVVASEHPAWEAALSAAGLLDAWVFPDGRMEHGLQHDDFLNPQLGSPLPPDASLASVLVSAEADAAQTALLERIGCRESAGACWVQGDGRWANGPHTGHAEKPAAEFLGHQAREAARQRRMEELKELLADADEELGRLSRGLEALAQAAVGLREEEARAPELRPLQNAWQMDQQMRQQLQAMRQRALDSEQHAATAALRLKEQIQQRDSDASDLGLLPHAAPEALQRFGETLSQYEHAALRLWPRWERLQQTATELERDLAREQEAETLAQSRDAEHAAAARRQAETQAEAQTLRATIGQSANEVLERLARALADKDRVAAEMKRIQHAVLEHAKALAALDERQHNALETQRRAEQVRNLAVTRVADYVGQGLFAEIDPERVITRERFSPTAAVDLARGMEKRLRDFPSGDEHWSRISGALIEQFQQLSDQLVRHSYNPRLTPFDGGNVNVITCEYQGESRSMRDFGEQLAVSLAERQRIFEERERAVIETHLIGEAATAIQRRIREGEDWVAGVNRELTQVPTSSGIQLKFEWKVPDTEAGALKEVRRIFLKTAATWSAEQRVQVRETLQSRIRAVREADDTLAWRDILERALDYRDWHRFGILKKKEGDTNWKVLTKRSFGTGSGGEKAMTLTVPQFAAAAAHYQSADDAAPRLILLDEVFVAIDSPTRARLMGLLETFDLDYVMTSEREWGVYPSVSALAIYQLVSRPTSPAVSVTRWVWNGRERLRDRSAETETSISA